MTDGGSGAQCRGGCCPSPSAEDRDTYMDVGRQKRVRPASFAAHRAMEQDDQPVRREIIYVKRVRVAEREADSPDDTRVFTYSTVATTPGAHTAPAGVVPAVLAVIGGSVTPPPPPPAQISSPPVHRCGMCDGSYAVVSTPMRDILRASTECPVAREVVSESPERRSVIEEASPSSTEEQQHGGETSEHDTLQGAPQSEDGNRPLRFSHRSDTGSLVFTPLRSRSRDLDE